jgi:hypothetical protein
MKHTVDNKEIADSIYHYLLSTLDESKRNGTDLLHELFSKNSLCSLTYNEITELYSEVIKRDCAILQININNLSSSTIADTLSQTSMIRNWWTELDSVHQAIICRNYNKEVKDEFLHIGYAPSNYMFDNELERLYNYMFNGIKET